MRRHKDSSTPDLFDIPTPVPAVEGALNFAIELRCLIAQLLKASPASRYQIAARMSELLATEITKYMLDAWTAESREAWRFPLEYAVAFEVACETRALTDWLATIIT